MMVLLARNKQGWPPTSGKSNVSGDRMDGDDRMYDGDVDADALGRYVSIRFYAFSKHFKTILHLICMHPRLSKYEWSDVRESRVFVQICVCIAPCTSDRNLVITMILRWLENPHSLGDFPDFPTFVPCVFPWTQNGVPWFCSGIFQLAMFVYTMIQSP